MATKNYTSKDVTKRTVNIVNRASVYGIEQKEPCEKFRPIARDYLEFKRQKKKRFVVAKVGYRQGGCMCPDNLELMTVKQQAKHKQKNKVWLWLHKQTFGKANDV